MTDSDPTLVQDKQLEEGLKNEESADQPTDLPVIQPAEKPVEKAVPAGGPKSRLSSVSKLYDINGDGVLDEAELAMRAMDKSGRGFLTNEKVYELMNDHLEMQKDLFRFKKIVIGLVAFVVLLTLSNLGTSLAAAYLAKDTTTNKNNDLVNSDTKQTVSTQTTTALVDVSVTGEEGRRLCSRAKGGGLDCTSSSYLSINSQGMDIIDYCSKGKTVAMSRTWSDGSVTHKTLCSNDKDATFSSDLTTLTLPNGVVITEIADGYYSVDGDAFTQDLDEICDVSNDCDDALVCDASKCVDRCYQNSDCESGFGCASSGICEAIVAAEVTTSIGSSCDDKTPCAVGLKCILEKCTCDPSDHTGCSGNTPICVQTIGGGACSCDVTKGSDHCASGQSCFYECGVGGGTPSCLTQSVIDTGYCGTGQTCDGVTGSCVASSALSPLGGVCDDSSQCEAPLTCDNPNPSCINGPCGTCTDSTSSTPTSPAAMGESCNAANPCESGLTCYNADACKDSACGTCGCDDAADCSSGEYCVDNVAMGTKYCSVCDPSDNSGCDATGAPACVQQMDGSHICGCSSDSHCDDASGETCATDCHITDQTRRCKLPSERDGDCRDTYNDDAATCDAGGTGRCMCDKDFCAFS